MRGSQCSVSTDSAAINSPGAKADGSAPHAESTVGQRVAHIVSDCSAGGSIVLFRSRLFDRNAAADREPLRSGAPSPQTERSHTQGRRSECHLDQKTAYNMREPVPAVRVHRCSAVNA